MVISKNVTPKSNANLANNVAKLKGELKENAKTPLDYILIKYHHEELSTMDDNSFSELLNFEYDISSYEDSLGEVENDIGYFLWKKLKENKIESLSFTGISDITLKQLVENRISIWDLHVSQIKKLIESLSIDIKRFLFVVSNFDLTFLNKPHKKDLFARLDSLSVERKEYKADLIEEGSYELFIAREERKREKFLKEFKDVLY